MGICGNSLGTRYKISRFHLQELVFNNDPSYTDRIVSFDRPFLIDLNECGISAVNYEDLIKLLPERLQVSFSATVSVIWALLYMTVQMHRLLSGFCVVSVLPKFCEDLIKLLPERLQVSFHSPLPLSLKSGTLVHGSPEAQITFWFLCGISAVYTLRRSHQTAP